MHTTIPFGGGGAGGESAECTAVAADILAGKTAIHKESNDEAGEGTMTNVAATEAAKSAVLSSGVLYERMTHGAHVTNASSGYPEVSLPQATLASVIGLTADIIKKGESILGITGTFEGYASTDYGEPGNLLSLGLIQLCKSLTTQNSSVTGTVSSDQTSTGNTVLRADLGRRTWPADDDANTKCAGMCWELTSKLDTTGYNYLVCEYYLKSRLSSGTLYSKYITPIIDWLTSDSASFSTVKASHHHTTSISIPECYSNESPSSTIKVLYDITAINERKARLLFGGFVTMSGDSNQTIKLITSEISLYKEKPSGSFAATVTYS